MMMSSLSFIWVLCFNFLILIIVVVSPPFALIVFSLNLSLVVVLVQLELLLHGVSGGPSATVCWPSIDQDIPSIVGVLSKRALYVLNFSVLRYVPVIRSQAYIFPFERHQTLLINLFLLKGFVSYNTRSFVVFCVFVSSY